MSEGRYKTSAARGQTIMTETSVSAEKAAGTNKSEAIKGRSMGGGARDVSHSITGAGSVAKK